MNIPNTGNPGNPNPAPAAPAAPATPPPAASAPASTPPPAAKAGVPQPSGAQGGPTVPLAALQEEREKRQSLQMELEQLRRTAAPSPQPQPVQAPQAPVADEAWRMQIEKLWETDPRRAVQAEIMQAVTWYDNVIARIDHEADALTNKYQDFPNYRTAAMNYVRSLPHEQRAMPGIVEMAYMLVRGQNVDNILKTREEELMARFQSGQMVGQMNVPGSYGSPMVPQNSVTLNDDQRRAAAAMNISEADYVRHIKAAR